MPNPISNFRKNDNTDLGNILITKEYLMSVYPQIANQLITPELWCWGFNSEGQLGDNTTTQRNTPVTTFEGGANWKQVSCKNRNIAAIKNDGTLWNWGFSNDSLKGSVVVVGTLGINDTTTFFRSTPVTTFAGGTNWKQVSTSNGGNHTAAIKTDGTLWVWGRNSYGHLGDNTTTNRLTPVTTFTGGTNWKQVECGYRYTAAIKTDGTLWTWGFNNGGQLGDNTTTQRNTPVTTFAGGTNWKQVSGGTAHTAAIKTDGTLWIWGDGSNGALGDNTTTGRFTPITTFSGGTNWKQVSCGGLSSAAIKTDGTLWVWGANTTGGVLGINSSSGGLFRSTPITTFAGGTNWKQVDISGSVVSAIKTDGTLWTWGSLSGDNTTVSRSTPVTTFAGGTNWKQVSSTAAIKTSDDLQGI